MTINPEASQNRTSFCPGSAAKGPTSRCRQGPGSARVDPFSRPQPCVGAHPPPAGPCLNSVTTAKAPVPNEATTAGSGGPGRHISGRHTEVITLGPERSRPGTCLAPSPHPWVSVPVSRLRAASCAKRRPALPAPHTLFTVPLLPRAHSGSRKDSGLGHCAPAARAPRLDPGYSCRCSAWLPAPGGSHPSACAQPRVRGAGLGPTGEVGLSTGTTLKPLLRMAAPAWRGTRVQEGPADVATRQSGQAPWDRPAPAAAAGGVGGMRPPPAPASGLPAGSGGAWGSQCRWNLLCLVFLLNAKLAHLSEEQTPSFRERRTDTPQ